MGMRVKFETVALVIMATLHLIAQVIHNYSHTVGTKNIPLVRKIHHGPNDPTQFVFAISHMRQLASASFH